MLPSLCRALILLMSLAGEAGQGCSYFVTCKPTADACQVIITRASLVHSPACNAYYAANPAGFKRQLHNTTAALLVHSTAAATVATGGGHRKSTDAMQHLAASSGVTVSGAVARAAVRDASKTLAGTQSDDYA